MSMCTHIKPFCSRISVIFTIGTQKRVRLPDQVLIQRFCLIVILCVAVLSAWTTSQPPTLSAIKLESGLKFYDCYFGAWGYAALGGKKIKMSLFVKTSYVWPKNKTYYMKRHKNHGARDFNLVIYAYLGYKAPVAVV